MRGITTDSYYSTGSRLHEYFLDTGILRQLFIGVSDAFFAYP
jgi:hypothetical protein